MLWPTCLIILFGVLTEPADAVQCVLREGGDLERDLRGWGGNGGLGYRPLPQWSKSDCEGGQKQIPNYSKVAITGTRRTGKPLLIATGFVWDTVMILRIMNPPWAISDIHPCSRTPW